MRLPRAIRLATLAAFLLGGLSIPVHTSWAEGPKIYKTGIPDQDKVFGEVRNINGVLEAAEKRMDALERQVSEPLGLPDGTVLADSVYAIRKVSNGGVSTMNAGGRTILLVGGDAPQSAKDAATALNEGTQELETIAADIQKYPARLEVLTEKASAMEPDAATLEANGMSADGLKEAKNKYTNNFMLTKYTGERATAVSKRASQLLKALEEGMARPLEVAPEPTPAPTPAPVAVAEPEPAPAPAPAPKVVQPAPKPGKSVPTVEETITKAWKQFENAEVDEAVALLQSADLLLPKQTRPVRRQDLIELFQLRALVNIVQGNATAAAWSATQALVIHPNSVPESRFGPAYGKLHKMLQKADLVQKVDVRVEGDGRAYLSGIEVTRGATIQLGQGQHLLQVEQPDGSWKGTVVNVSDGFVVEF
jgi:hypothetical protein